MNPDNPFSKLSDKDMLIFNPNYEAYLSKLNKNQDKVSELQRIMNQPHNPHAKKQKKELALYAFLRSTGKDQQSKTKLDVIEASASQVGIKSKGNNASRRPTQMTNLLEKSQSHLGGTSRSRLNVDVAL